MPGPRPYLMEEMTWQEVRDAAAAGLPAVLPIGSTEQHGPHLPLNTDALIPTEIALAAAQITPMIVAPAIHYGAMSRPLIGGGETFPGTVSLRAATLIATIREALLGLAKGGFTKLCLFNWHYENAAYLWEAADLAVTARDGFRVLRGRSIRCLSSRRMSSRSCSRTASPAGTSNTPRIWRRPSCSCCDPIWSART